MKKEDSEKGDGKGEKVTPIVVKGVTSTLKRLLGKKVSTSKILELVVPEFVDKGISEKVAKNRIHAYLFRLKKAKEAKVSKK